MISTQCYGYSSDQWNYAVSEDCLYLNVIRPSGSQRPKLPVAVWIHGGGFTAGGGVDQRYNASFMVQNSVAIGKPIIVVNFNYRLSTWGFLSSNEVAGVGQTNLGLRDQRLALQWVQENIGAFGGDPSQVVIFGESAGGASVGYHLTAYGGRDDKLFRGAIMQSGNPVSYSGLRGPEAYQQLYNALVTRTGCNGTLDTLQCLRTVPAEQVNAAINTTSMPLFGFQPWLDGDFIREYTSLQLSAGQFVHVPIISGANSDEGSAFSPQGANSTEDFYTFLTASGNRAVPPAFADQILEAYPDDPAVNVIANLGDARTSGTFGNQFRRTASYYGDAVFIANRRLTCQTWATAGVPAYCYRFNALTANTPPEIGVTHFQEISFVFLNLDGVGYPPVNLNPFANKSESYLDLARFMDSSWVSFVHDLDPNSWRQSYSWGGSEQSWPVYDYSNPQNYVFDANISSYVEPDTYRAKGIDLINANNVGVYHR
jgi:carboxylesterase type B